MHQQPVLKWQPSDVPLANTLGVFDANLAGVKVEGGDSVKTNVEQN